MNEQAILAKAADIMANRGMTKHRAIDYETGAVCMSGAVALACGYPLDSKNFANWTDAEARVYTDAMFALNMFLHREVNVAAAPNYNDLPSTTLEDAVLMLKKAADQ